MGTNVSNTEAQDFEILDIITMLSFILQIENYAHDKTEADNNTIMKALDTQNKEFLGQILENQKTIIENQQRILDLLTK